MPKLTIELSQEEYDALEKLAKQRRRTPDMQAAHLVAQECLPDFRQLTLTGLSSGTPSGYEGRIYPPPMIAGTPADNFPLDWSES